MKLTTDDAEKVARDIVAMVDEKGLNIGNSIDLYWSLLASMYMNIRKAEVNPITLEHYFTHHMELFEKKMHLFNFAQLEKEKTYFRDMYATMSDSTGMRYNQKGSVKKRKEWEYTLLKKEEAK